MQQPLMNAKKKKTCKNWNFTISKSSGLGGRRNPSSKQIWISLHPRKIYEIPQWFRVVKNNMQRLRSWRQKTITVALIRRSFLSITFALTIHLLYTLYCILIAFHYIYTCIIFANHVQEMYVALLVMDRGLRRYATLIFTIFEVRFTITCIML